jgi:hypothetical protein
MKKIYMLLSVIGMLSACVTTDMMNNNFVAVSAQPVPDNMASNWTGSIGPWLITFKLNSNGEGVYCYSGATQNGLQKTKINGNTILIQDGTKFNIVKRETDSMILKAPYYGMREHTIFKDKDLSKASIFCQDSLSSSFSS